MRTLNADLARKCADATGRRGRRRLLAVKRLPFRKVNVGEQNTFGAEGLQPGNLQIRAIEPDLAKDLRAIAPTQHSHDIVPRGLVVELLEKHTFFFADLRPEQRIDQVLRTEILDRLFADALYGYRADEKFVFRRDRDAKDVAVAGHVKNRGADHRRLADHADLRGTL